MTSVNYVMMPCKALLYSIIALLASFMESCVGRVVASGAVEDTVQTVEEYHADNDIAMIVSSIADAVREGEPLDTLEYNFEGILTDGEGRPLYTDLQGAPGEWEVDIISSSYAVVRNMFLGDLLPDYLESYLASSMNLSSEDLLDCNEFDNDDDTEVVVYDLDGGYLRLETRAAVAPNGLEGPLVSIIVTKTPPSNY